MPTGKTVGHYALLAVNPLQLLALPEGEQPVQKPRMPKNYHFHEGCPISNSREVPLYPKCLPAGYIKKIYFLKNTDTKYLP
jgi:hypothetical protein